jgi:S1-C subfamily serine protease
MNSLLLISALLVSSPAPQAEGVYKKALNSTIQLEVKSGTSKFLGTGWIMGDGYTLVTAKHVVENEEMQLADLKNIKLVGSQYKGLAAVKMWASTEYDVVALKFNKKLGPSLKLAANNPAVGEDVFFLGWSLEDPTPSFLKGMISAYPIDEPWSIQVQGSFLPGNSGSAVLNKKGEVVGLVNSLLSVYPDYGYCTKVSALRSEFKLMGIKF